MILLLILCGLLVAALICIRNMRSRICVLRDIRRAQDIAIKGLLDSIARWKREHSKAIEESVRDTNELLAEIVIVKRKHRAKIRKHNHTIAGLNYRVKGLEKILQEYRGKITELDRAAQNHLQVLMCQAFLKCYKCGCFATYLNATKRGSGFICNKCKLILDRSEDYKNACKRRIAKNESI